MVQRFQITCITKPIPLDPDSRIERVGGPGFNLSLDEAVDMQSSGQAQFFVDQNGFRADVEIVASRGLIGGVTPPYLRTMADKTRIDNLLSLPQCPVNGLGTLFGI